MGHPFTKGKRGVCIHPVPASGTDHFIPCGKMKSLHDYAVIQQERRDSGSLAPAKTSSRQFRPTF